MAARAAIGRESDIDLAFGGALSSKSQGGAAFRFHRRCSFPRLRDTEHHFLQIRDGGDLGAMHNSESAIVEEE
jgi:hypothetical protein